MKGSRPLDEHEIDLVSKSFYGGYAKRDKALFVMGVKTGFRISELLSLKIKDVYQHNQVLDQITVARKSMKGKTEGRTIPLHCLAKEALAEWLEDPHCICIPEYSLFQSREGGSLTVSRAHKILQDAYATNNLTGKLGTHTMRKTFANRVYTVLKGDLVKTQSALGHRNINSTVSYLSFRQEEVSAAILAI